MGEALAGPTPSGSEQYSYSHAYLDKLTGTLDELMIVARHTLGLGNFLIFNCCFEHHPVSKLVNLATLHLLPWSLVLGIVITTRSFQGCTPAVELLLRDEDVGRALVQVDAYSISGL